MAQMVKHLPARQETCLLNQVSYAVFGEGIGNPMFLPGESHGQRSLAGYSPRGHKEEDTTE